MNKSTNVTLESLATKPRIDKDVRQICIRHNWDYNDFTRIKVEGTRNQWIYIKKK